MAVDKIIRRAGYCGLESEGRICMKLAAHETDDHFDDTVELGGAWTQALTDEEKRGPVEIIGRLADPTTR